MPVRQVRVRRFGTGSAVIARLTLCHARVIDRPRKDTVEGTRNVENSQEFADEDSIMLRGMALLDTVFDDAAARGAKRHADACDELRRALLAWLIAGLLLVCGGVALGVVAAGERVPALDLVITNAVQAPRGLALDELAWAVSG